MCVCAIWQNPSFYKSTNYGRKLLIHEVQHSDAQSTIFCAHRNVHLVSSSTSSVNVYLKEMFYLRVKNYF